MKTSKPVTLDLTQFVSVDFGFALPPRPLQWPRKFNHIRDCIDSSIHMAGQIEFIDHCISSFIPERVRAAYFRSSLTELSRVEDLSKSFDTSFAFNLSHDPSLHLIRLLRNYQIHITPTILAKGQTTVQFSGEQMVFHGFIAENVTIQELRKLKSSNPYSEIQLAQLIELFELRQRKFGVIQLLYHLAKRVESFTLNALTQTRLQ